MNERPISNNNSGNNITTYTEDLITIVKIILTKLATSVHSKCPCINKESCKPDYTNSSSNLFLANGIGSP